MTQFSLFGAAVAPPCVDDLAGILLAGGHWVRTVGGARLSIVVADRWRAAALADAFLDLGFGGSDAVIPAEGGIAVRTSFHPALVDRATRWTRGAREEPPPGFVLSPGGLRLWAAAAGRRDEVGYLLATADLGDRIHTVAGAQLARLGLAAVSVSGRAGGPGWRITSAKRLRRLAELLGVPPSGAGADWPA